TVRPMSESRVVLVKIAGMFLIILAGWLARRRGFLRDEASGILSRIVVDAAFPALVFTQMLRTVDAASLRQDWLLPLLPFPLVAIAYLVGLGMAPLFGGKAQRNTVLFLVTSPNWVFLPLPIAEALYGAAGVRVILLCNVGAQLALWSIGVWILHGRISQALRQLAANIGLWATAGGIALALAFPALRQLGNLHAAPASLGGMAGAAGIDALAMVGSLTIPLSLLAIGAQLGAIPISIHRLPVPLWGVVSARLVAAPLVTVGLGLALARAGFGLPDIPRRIVVLVAAMPVAIVCSVMAERYGGDTQLAAQAIFLSTLFSLVTVPALFYLVS
ncbi:MAG: AEC family transporter, partial [Geothrix sp.]|nr:AEC family transporter [Geothrix sp.]